MNDPIAVLTAALAGSYRIERHLGEGGMATVYLAQDVKHDRKVALKVLRPELAAVIGAERFLQEIKVTANLQHPNILPLYDSGRAGTAPEFLYYVMPFVEGETLRQRMTRERQLPVEETVALIKDVADALHFAHEQGVVHRDIKPENILLQRGKPLVADFGIALAVSQAGGSRLTETGLSLGTPHYMSPEQATGDREIDARSDIYSLGAMAYEMLVGEPPHIGSSVQAIVARILSDDPAPITRSRSLVPPNVDAAIQRALAKSPADRFTSAARFAEALTNPAFRLGLPGAQAAEPAGPWRQRALALGGVAGLLLVAAAWGWLRPRPETPRPVSRFSIALPDDQSLATSGFTRLDITPDGTRLVYAGKPAGQGQTSSASQLWLRPLDQLEATPLPGTEGAIDPFISPDGQRVGFMEFNSIGGLRLRVVSLAGGPPTTIADTMVFPFGAAWGPDGIVYFTQQAAARAGRTQLARVAGTGGTPVALTAVDTAAGETGHIWPDVLPNGKGVLFSIGRGASAREEATDIAIADIKTGKHRILTRGVRARYARSGHIIIATAEGNLMAAPFDQDRMELTGDPVSLVEGLGVRIAGAVDLGISANGSLIYTTGVFRQGTDQVVWVTRTGVATEVDPEWTGTFSSVALSPDDRRAAVAIGRGAESQIWVKQLDQGPLSRLTFEGTNNNRPTWSPDGHDVLYQSERTDTSGGVYARRADGSAMPVRVLRHGREGAGEVELSRDGRWMVVRPGGGSQANWGDLYAFRPGQDSTPAPLLTTQFPEFNPALSPDGRWLAYVSTESGRREVYVRPFPNVNDAKWQVSTGGGEQPLWAHSGRELFYVGPDAMNAVEVERGSSFATGAHRTLFPLTGYRGMNNGRERAYGLSSDDQRFLMIRLRVAQEGPATQLIVVQNWFEELKRIR